MSSKKIVRLNFIHLNSSLPKFLIQNVNRCSALFPEIEIELITDQDEGLRSFVSDNLVIQPYKRLEMTSRLLERMTHKRNFRSDFWRVSIERIIALLELVIQDNIPRLHIESDMLLLQDFSFQWIIESRQPMWCKYSLDRDSAAMMFVPDKESATRLLQLVYKQLESNPSHTDMSILRSIAKNRSIEFDYFPMCEDSTDEITVERASVIPWQVLSDKNEKLPAVLDSAAFGMWITGQDTRNNLGLLILHENFADLKILTNPDSYTYSLHGNGSHLVLSKEEKSYALVSLHVHSKELGLFSINNEIYLQYYLQLAERINTIRLFRPNLFLGFLREGLSNGSLIRTLAFIIRNKLQSK